MIKIINLVEDTPGNPLCRPEHGLSFYIETEKHKLLMDAGATDLFLHNAKALGIDLGQVDTFVLSHGHYDHAGGVLAFAKMNPKARLYMKQSVGGDYYHLKEGGEKYIGINKGILSLEQCVRVEGSLRIDDELFLFTDITGDRCLTKGSRKFARKAGNTFVQDTFAHEQCLVIAQGEKKVLLSGCAHTGILNILDRYAEIFRSEPDVVISGFHLAQKAPYSDDEKDNIRNIAKALLETKSVFYTGHCTGQKAYGIMKEMMGSRLLPIHSGEKLLEIE